MRNVLLSEDLGIATCLFVFAAYSNSQKPCFVSVCRDQLNSFKCCYHDTQLNYNYPRLHYLLLKLVQLDNFLLEMLFRMFDSKLGVIGKK